MFCVSNQPVRLLTHVAISFTATVCAPTGAPAQRRVNTKRLRSLTSVCNLKLSMGEYAEDLRVIVKVTKTDI